VTSGFPTIGVRGAGIGGENSFWPSFTDIMMVVTMIFLMATSLLVVRNWQLVAELQESVAAEQIAAQMIESTSQENATLEERLANAEQANSILRLRMLKKEEELSSARSQIEEQQAGIAALQRESGDLKSQLEQTRAKLDETTLELESANAQNQALSNRIAALNEKMSNEIDALNRQLAQQRNESEQTRNQLSAARGEIAALSASNESQQQNIAELTREKTELNQEVEKYNQQLLTLKGDYETVKSKYEELIKPARTAKGKYIAEVYYVKTNSGKVIRYREPGDSGYSRMSLAELEKHLDKLKAEKGKDLYVKIIIPENSGLSYNEAWEFMRNLLVKYDYYYQD